MVRVYMAQNGLRGYLEYSVPWVVIISTSSRACIKRNLKELSLIN